ncbi:unnamed protein product [Toxocara canis]|uniref:Protein broad-minded n=1 Tax=Toxocara canis TaxID=6265 RepID=A0A183UFB7_TOXCA|nr:unnamed protein product [Toxocara canis]
MCLTQSLPTPTASACSTVVDVRLMERRISRAAMHISKSDSFKRLKLDIIARSRRLARLRYDSLQNDYSEHSLAENSTFGLDLAQSTRFAGDADTTRLVEQLEDADASTQERVTLLSSLLSLSTSAIGKRKHLTRILRICEKTVMDESTFMSTLLLLKKLFNTKDLDIVSDVLCSFVAKLSDILHSSLSEDAKLKAIILLFKMICVCPALWSRFQAAPVSKMITSLVRYIGSVDISELSINNPVAILAALDPRANWMRSWAHALSSRTIMRASLPSFAKKIKNFLHDRPEVNFYVKYDSSKYQSVFLHYSPKELLILLNTNLCSMLFIWMKYDDLYAIFSDHEWVRILEAVIAHEFDRDSKSSSSKTVVGLLCEVAACSKPAHFLITPEAIGILARIRSVSGIRILRIALTVVLQPSDSSVTLICAEVNRHICSQSKAKRQEALLVLNLLANRISWDNLGSHIHYELVESDHGNQETSAIVQHVRAVREMHIGESVARFLKYGAVCNLSIPSRFVEVTSADRPLLVSKVMELFRREGDPVESVTLFDTPSMVKLPAQLVALVWQPQTGADFLKCFDCNTFLQNIIQKAYELGDASMFAMLRVFTLNLNVAMELRRRAKMLRRLFQVSKGFVDYFRFFVIPTREPQAIVRWNSKEIGAYFDSLSVNAFALFASSMIGGPSEVTVSPSLTSSLIKNPRSIIKLMYVGNGVYPSEEEEVPIRSVGEVINIIEKGGSFCAAEVLTFLASTVTVDESILTTRHLSTSESADDSKTNGHTFMRECTAVLDYAIYLKIIATRKNARKLLSQLRLPYVRKRDESDWFLNVIFLMLRMDAQLTNFVCARLIHHKNAAFFWPSANGRYADYLQNYTFAIFAEMLKTPRLKGIKEIFEREHVSLYHYLLLCSNQIFLNVLNWPQICQYVILSIAEGPGFQARHFCALLLHVEAQLRHHDSRGNLHALLVNLKQLSSFSFTNYAALVDELYKEAYAQTNDGQE